MLKEISSFGASKEASHAIIYIGGHNVPPPPLRRIGLIFVHVPKSIGNIGNFYFIALFENDYRASLIEVNKTKDWALVQNAALVIKIKELKLGLVRLGDLNLTQSNLIYSTQT